MKEHIISALRVFVATFIVTISTSIASAGSVSWTSDFWFPLAVAAVSAGLKVAINTYSSSEVNSIQK